MAECQALAAWAESLPAVEPTRPATNEQIERHLEFLEATLPAKNVDADSGRRRFAVYTSVLCRYSNEALAFMARRVIETLNWFPTPKQCLDVLAEYRPPATEAGEALQLCSRFAAAAFDDWMANLRAGQPIGDVPDHWLRVAEAQGALRRLDDGSYVSRARFVGPIMKFAEEA